MADEVIGAVRETGPPGIAEPTMIDSLAAQARAMGMEGKAPAWAENVVRHHLEEFARCDAAAVADALGVSVRQVREVFERLRTQLRPCVLPDFQEHKRLVAVDVVVTRRGPDLRVAVPDSRWFGLRITRVPVHLRVDVEASSWLRGFEQEAVQLVRQIDARAAVLTRVAGHAVAHQTAFLTTGPIDHRPLTRVQVARELGLHPSTVSRAVAGKTLRGPDGAVMPLARLFGGNIAVKEELRLLLAEGSHTDEELRRELEDRGFEVARRTVAKYRREIGVSPVSE